MDSAVGEALKRALDPGEREFREIADFAPVMIWRSSPDKLCDWFNKPWLDFVGRTMEQEVGYGWSEGVHPDDYDRCVGIYVSAFDARRPFSMEYRLRRHDGEYRWVLDNGAPYARGGAFAGYFGSCIDVTDHHRAEARQKLMIDELNHRVKNTLATVQSLAAASARNSESVDDFQGRFGRRLAALSRAHDLLTQTSWEGADLGDVVRQTLSPYTPRGQAVTISGPPVRLNANAAVTVHMGLHEMATNAAKYGALAHAGGRLDVSWGFLPGPPPMLQFDWLESGVPNVAPPSQEGFGTRLIKAVGRELGARVEPRLNPDGMSFRWTAPVSEKLAV